MRTWLPILFGSLMPVVSVAFVGVPDAAGRYLRWALNPPDARVPATLVNPATRSIIYRLDAAGWSLTNTAAELTAVRTAFDQWQAVTGTVLRFEEGPLVTGTQDINTQDNRNTVFWTTKTFVNGGRDNLSGVLALTYVASFTEGNVVVEADMVFNGAEYRWNTDISDTTGRHASVEATALHEVGHFVGLLHSPVGGATMLAVGDLGVNSQIGLAQDEWLAARFLYGSASTLAGAGRISGSVTMSGQPVLGAGVFVEDGRGTLVGGTVTRSNGTYLLPALPPGGYTVRAAPLDPLASVNYLVRGVDIAPEYRGANANFLATADRAVAVTAGGEVKADFAMGGGSPLRIVRVLRPASDLSAPSYNNKPVSVAADGRILYLGVVTPSARLGTEDVSVTGNGLTVMGPVEVVSPVLGTQTLVAVPVRVETTATPGLRSLRLVRGSVTAWAHGFLEVLPPFPDVNFDGFDDRFQRQFWPRFTAADAAPGADPDGDGFPNVFEQVSGSNPTNRFSVNFEIESVRVTAEGARVRSQAANGRRFQLYGRDTVPGADWSPVGSAVMATTNWVEFLDGASTRQVRFYRVHLVP